MNLPGFYPSVYIEKILYALSWTRLDTIPYQRNPRQLFALTDTFFWRAHIYLQRFKLVSVYIVYKTPPTLVLHFLTGFLFLQKKEALPYIEVLRILFNYLNHLNLVHVHLAFLAFVELGSPQVVQSPVAPLHFY